jgi:DNA mismatch repair protein MutS2
LPEAKLDLDPESRRALNLDGLLEWIAESARTAPGARELRELTPRTDPAWIAAELDAVEEVRRQLQRHGMLLPHSLPDPGPHVGALSVLGADLEALALRGLALVADAASRLGERMRSLEAEEAPRLRRLGEEIPDLRDAVGDVLAYVDGDGQIADEASDELRRIRAERARVGRRLRRLLEGFLRDPQAGPMIQDDFITQRNGRYVIPVRIDAPRPVRGIVHASSASGATQFVEPLESVELNNDRVRLAESEREEQLRLLSAWTGALRERFADLRSALSGLGRVDSLQARALFAEQVEAVRPIVEPGASPRFADVRHPLLDRRLEEQGKRAVPTRMHLEPEDRVLVLSGPNAGGKTVALKTVGLAVLMAQAGIPVPAVELRLPIYRQVRADIGDHQSIQADLSTFSAHVRALCRFLDNAAPPALFLFDELGTGTEPSEGAALAQAVLESLIVPGMTTLATTHHGALKTWAMTTEQAASAALEFDSSTLQPTYRILMGAAGASAGLEIAARFGLDSRIVERARDRLGSEGAQSEAYLERLRELLAELEERHAGLVRQEAEWTEARLREQREAEESERAREQRVERELERVVSEFRESARKELSGIRDERERRRTARRHSRVEGRLRMERERRRVELTPPAARAEPIDPATLREGAEVFVRSLARQGKIHALRGGRAEVRLGRMLFTVELDDLSAAGPGDEKRPAARRSRVAAPEAGSASLPDAPPGELKLLGRTVDEALDELDKYLDASALAGSAEVRIIHGHGTGRLRTAVRKFLTGHVHVKSHRPGRPNEGGDGATIAQLR